MHNEIEKYRRQAGLDKTGLARALGVNRATIIRWESGAYPVPMASLERLAAFFHVAPADLVPSLAVTPSATPEEAAHVG